MERVVRVKGNAKSIVHYLLTVAGCPSPATSRASQHPARVFWKLSRSASDPLARDCTLLEYHLEITFTPHSRSFDRVIHSRRSTLRSQPDFPFSFFIVFYEFCEATYFLTFFFFFINFYTFL